jgi:hypothetical protein
MQQLMILYCIVIVSETAMEMKIHVGSAHTIIAEGLHYKKVQEQWIPRHVSAP